MLIVYRKTHHAVHEPHKAPEGNCIVLHDCVDGREEIAHTLYVAKTLVVFVVGKQHILHLLQMDVRANICKWRVGIRMRNILTSKDGDIAICAMYILLYTTNPIEWGKSVNIQKSESKHEN